MATMTRRARKQFMEFERYEVDKVKLAQQILRAADKRGWVFAHLAEWSGVSIATIRRLESGTTKYPRLDTIWKLAQATGYRIELEESGRARRVK